MHGDGHRGGGRGGQPPLAAADGVGPPVGRVAREAGGEERRLVDHVLCGERCGRRLALMFVVEQKDGSD